jgi:hypothetical protein
VSIALAVVALGGCWSREKLFYPNTDAKQVQSVANCLLGLLFCCKCNADTASSLISALFFPGEPVGVANNLKALVEGWDFLLEDRETLIGVEGSWDIMDSNLEPGLDGEGFLEAGDMLPDVNFFQKVLCSEGRSGGKDNVLAFAGGD